MTHKALSLWFARDKPLHRASRHPALLSRWFRHKIRAMSGILRTMDAIGIDALFLLDGGVELYHPTLIRSSMGAIFWKRIAQTSFEEFRAWAQTAGRQLIGASAHADVDYKSLVPQTPWALVLGSEQKGLSAEQVQACDVTDPCRCGEKLVR